MYLKKNIGVILPKQIHPYILDGKDQPKSIKRVFVTPEGYFPRMADITRIYGRSRREVEDRRIRNPRPRFTDWYIIRKPTVEDVEKALENVNRLYVEKFYESDHSPIANHIDDLLFKEHCWLLEVTNPSPTNLLIEYAFNGDDYTVTYTDWLKGVRPHKEKLKWRTSSVGRK